MENEKSQFDRFTVRARKALVVAQSEAQRRGQVWIEPEHILLGLLQEQGETACEALRLGGVTPEQARVDVEGLLPPVLPPEQATCGEIRLSERTKQVISWSVEELCLLQQTHFATGHFLLGMLREERIGQLFAIWEITLEAARASLASLGEASQREQQPPSTSTETVQLDLAHQEKVTRLARQVTNARRVMILVMTGIVVGVTFPFLLIPDLSWRLLFFYIRLQNTPVLGWQPVEGWTPLLTLFTGLLIGGFVALLVLPFFWYRSQFLLKRSGLTRISTLNWLRGTGLTYLRFCCDFCLLLELMNLFFAIQPQLWWVWTALVVRLFFTLMGGLVGSYGFLWQMRKLVPLHEDSVAERFQALLQRLGLPACLLYRLEGNHRANAFFAGWGPGRRVVLTKSLLERFSLDEIEVILAHELGHFAHHDIWTRNLMNGLTLLGFLGLFQFEMSNFFFLNSLSVDPTGQDSLSIFSQPLGLLLILALVSGLLLVRNRYIRYQEDRADEYALGATNNIPAFKNAMTRLINLNLVLATPRGNAARQATHPNLQRRLQHADEYAARTIIYPKTRNPAINP